jgi:predicted ATP-grasp superfamily ATP-dependent carboligase
MKILVSEFITGGGLIGESLPASLAQEGQMMLDAIVTDLVELNEIDVEVILDERCVMQHFLKKPVVHTIKNNYLKTFRQLCREVDAVLPIAPESDSSLEMLSRLVLEEGKLLLGSSPEVIRLTSSKLATAEFLANQNIPVINTQLINDWNFERDYIENSPGWIVKPDQGVGCEQVFFCETEESIRTAASKCEKAIIQPMIRGIPASLSVLCDKGHCRVIGYNEQIIEQQNNRLQYTGTRVNSLLDYKDQLDQLANSVVAVLSELRGYIGMDVIIGYDKITVVEINPRLTTSYVALRESINLNPAGLILDIFNNNVLPELSQSEFKEVLVSVV